MIQMLKCELYMNWFYFLLVFFTFPMIHGEIYPQLVFLTILAFAMYNSFYGNFKSHTNRSFVSMPIDKKVIVLSRHLFLICAIIVSLLYLWLVNFLAMYGFPLFNAKFSSASPILAMAVLLNIFLACFIPFFYYFQSFQRVFIMHALFIFLCLIGWITFANNYYGTISDSYNIILDIIARQPLFISVLIVGILHYLSFKLSVYLFKKRDLV